MKRATHTHTHGWIGTKSAFSIAICLALILFALDLERAGAGIAEPLDEDTIVAATVWLNGLGVDVHYTASPEDDHPLNADGTIQYECVELIVRLYARLGYTKRWPINHAYEVAAVAGKQGFEDWMLLANGGTVPPRQGDIVVWPESYNDGTGHVAIVNRVDNNSIQVVHQNVWRGDQPIPLSEVKMEYVLQNGQWRFTLVGWDGVQPVGWIHSARMEEWLSRRYPVSPLIDTNSPRARHDAQ